MHADEPDRQTQPEPRRRWQTPLGLAKLGNALRGLSAAWREDRSVRWKLPLFAAVLLTAVLLQSWIDLLLLVVVTFVLLAAELFNTAIEELCNVVQPDFDERIGRIKDIAAAAVMLCHAAWLCVVLVEAARLANALASG